jgi:hypothetical protein
MSAILGGLFNSRLNMKLREEKGYTYGAGAGYDMRRGAGPFAARAAVNTEVTVPAVMDMFGELTAMRDTPVKASELAAARDFLVGVFPLRFETAGAVVGALSGLAVHGLGVDELVSYRERIEAVDVDAVGAAARAHLDVDTAAVVLVDVDVRWCTEALACADRHRACRWSSRRCRASRTSRHIRSTRQARTDCRRWGLAAGCPDRPMRPTEPSWRCLRGVELIGRRTTGR